MLLMSLLTGEVEGASSAPIHDAARGGQAAELAKLLGQGADVDARAVYGRTPLHHAAWCGHLACARLLLDKGAEVDARESQFGWTPLQFAARGCHTELVRLLLDRGADVDGGREDETPLHRAVFAAFPETVLLLLERGADPSAPGPWGTALRGAEFVDEAWAARARYATKPERKAHWEAAHKRMTEVIRLLEQASEAGAEQEQGGP